MAKTKTKMKTAKKNWLVTTTTKVDAQEFRVTIKRLGRDFRIIAALVHFPGNEKSHVGPALRLIKWACRFNEKEADALVGSLALELGYEVDETPLIDSTLYLLKGRDGLFELRFYSLHKGPDAGIVISRAAAQKLLKALAKVLDWELTG